MPLENALQKPLNAVSVSWQSNMAVGVHQDHGLNIPMQSMVDLRSVEMAKEDPGLMTSIGS